MEQTAIDWFAQELYEKFEMNGDGKLFNELFIHYKEVEKQEKQKTIEEVFEWLTKNDYVTDLKETLIEQYKNQ